jgi:predicted metal-dependent phosphoesterase TrpH
MSSVMRRPVLRVDLHMHTTLSDGALTPSELMNAVAKAGLDYFSVTDHDTLAFYAKHGDLAAPFGKRLITGVEVSTFGADREMHILGYGVPREPRALGDVLLDRAGLRRTRARRIVERLNALGVELTMEEVEALAPAGMIGRPHIADALVRRGAARDRSDAFERYIGSHRPAFIPSTTLAPERAIAAINACGGISVLAHPTRNHAEELLEALAAAGLQGVEVYSSRHDAADAARLKDKARALHLIITAGTDFHRPHDATPHPGRDVDAQELAPFLARLGVTP